MAWSHCRRSVKSWDQYRGGITSGLWESPTAKTAPTDHSAQDKSGQSLAGIQQDKSTPSGGLRGSATVSSNQPASESLVTTGGGLSLYHKDHLHIYIGIQWYCWHGRRTWMFYYLMRRDVSIPSALRHVLVVWFIFYLMSEDFEKVSCICGGTIEPCPILALFGVFSLCKL